MKVFIIMDAIGFDGYYGEIERVLEVCSLREVAEQRIAAKKKIRRDDARQYTVSRGSSWDEDISGSKEDYINQAGSGLYIKEMEVTSEAYD